MAETINNTNIFEAASPEKLSEYLGKHCVLPDNKPSQIITELIGYAGLHYEYGLPIQLWRTVPLYIKRWAGRTSVGRRIKKIIYGV